MCDCKSQADGYKCRQNRVNANQFHDLSNGKYSAKEGERQVQVQVLGCYSTSLSFSLKNIETKNVHAPSGTSGVSAQEKSQGEGK